MKRVALSCPASFTGAPMLARPERASDRLLVWLWKPGSEAGGAAFIDAYVSEGWNVLEVGCASPDSEGTPAGIVDAVGQSRSRADGAPAIFIADQGTASAVCRAVLLAHRSGLLTGPSGLVTVDAFADDAVKAICEELAGLENLATIWAVHREERTLREPSFRHHMMLQVRGRETHFLVLPDKTRSLVQQLADSRDPLGREMRWLLDPVHSRSA
ncbi:MAG TPA: hypothetical protein VHJ00_15130 [Bradyrhizobium sp.]|nr:hypothetical protein [Bradyrhizobium sp.]